MSGFGVFAARYRRFLRGLEIADRLCPSFARHFVAGWWGRLASPYRLHAAKILAAMQAGLRLSGASSRLAWRRWRESHGQFCLSIFSYPQWSPAMLAQGVRSDDLALLRRAASTGGLLLTYHSHHHNSLFCLFGFAGAKISVLAASEEGSPLYPAIGRYIHRINRGSALHFGGGDYLFTDNLRSLVKEVKAVFDEGGMVASLCDFNGGNTAYDLLGRRLAPPTGAITLALKQGVPIYAAMLYGGYGAQPVLRMREIDRAGGESGVVRQYLDFLIDIVSATPGAWQGWEWFGDLPPMIESKDSEILEGHDVNWIDITRLWDAAHPHLRPAAKYLPLAGHDHGDCPACQGRTVRVLAKACIDDAWASPSPVDFCPACERFFLADAPSGARVTAVDGRLWFDQPTFLNIEPTTRCNFNCWYCVGRHMKQEDIKVENFARMLDNFPTVRTIALVGEGEPLLHKDFFTMARMAKDRGIKVMIISNGSTFSQSVVKKLCEAEIAYVAVSIDSTDPATFAGSRPGGDLEKIWQGIERLRQYRDAHGYRYPRIAVKGTLFTHTENELLPIVEEAKRKGVDIFESFQALNPMKTYTPIYPGDKLTELAHLESVAAAIGRDSAAAGHIMQSIGEFCADEGIEFAKSGRPNALRKNCDEQWIYSLLSGDVTPCCQIKTPVSARWNLFDHRIDEILADHEYENVRFNLWNGLFPVYCDGCWKTR